MTAIAQLSDIHFGSDAPGTAERLADALNRARFDLVILSGDLTMAARHSEFAAARAFIDALSAPTLSVPGNHDITPYNLIERFAAPYARFRRHVGALEPAFANDDVAVVGLNTARRMRLRLDWSHGSVSRRQIAAVADRFAALPQTPFRIVVAHHPFLEEDTADLGERPRVMVKRARRALARFAELGVHVVMAGHLHRTYAATYTGPSHPVVTVQAGTALSHRTRGEPNSFNRVDILGDTLTVRPVVSTADGWQAGAPIATVAASDAGAA
ncbi:MAG: metallophosphoesterase [Pseudomonadota bacterium]